MWEIYAYQNVESLFGIFNAVAAMVGAAGYASAVAAVVFSGFIGAMLAYAFAPEKLIGWKWLGSLIIVYSILLVPRVTVGIVDKTGGESVRVVDNVPLGMAMFGSLTSTIGNTVTELFETAFQTLPGKGGLPSEFTYQKTGLMFGNRMVRTTSTINFVDPAFRADMTNFVINCTYYDLADGHIKADDFSKSTDLWSLMGDPNPARFTTITRSDTATVVPCKSSDGVEGAYENLSGRMPSQLATALDMISKKMNPTLPPSLASTEITAQIEQSSIRNSIADASKSAVDIVRQNAVINLVSEAGRLQSQKSNDPTAAILAMSVSGGTAQQNASWLVGGKIAEQSLPVLRNVLEAMTYAMFPMFVMLLFLTHGQDTMKGVKSYATILIWIQMWPPMYAILNYMAMVYAQYDLAAAADLGGGAKGLALRSAGSIYTNAISGEAVVGYLVASIPILSWTALKRMENLGQALAQGFGAIGSTAGAVASAGAMGNYNMGVATMDQRNISPSDSNGGVTRTQDADGTWHTHTPTGLHATERLMNKGPASLRMRVGKTLADVNEKKHEEEAAYQHAVASTQAYNASLGRALTHSSSSGLQTVDSAGNSIQNGQMSGKRLDNLKQYNHMVAKALGTSDEEAASIMVGLAARAGVRAGGGGSADDDAPRGPAPRELPAGTRTDAYGRKVPEPPPAGYHSHVDEHGKRSFRPNLPTNAAPSNSTLGNLAREGGALVTGGPLAAAAMWVADHGEMSAHAVGAANKNYGSKASHQQANVEQFATPEALAEYSAFANEAKTNAGFLRNIVGSDQRGGEIAARVNESRERMEKDQQAYTEKHKQTESVKDEYSRGVEGTYDVFADPRLANKLPEEIYRAGENFYQNPQALERAYSAALGNVQFNATPMEGMMSQPGQDPHSIHEKAVHDPKYSRDAIDAKAAHDRGAVLHDKVPGGYGPGAGANDPLHHQTSAMSQLEKPESRESIKGRAGALEHKVMDGAIKNQPNVHVDPDGTLHTPYSQTGRVLRHAGADAADSGRLLQQSGAELLNKVQDGASSLFNPDQGDKGAAPAEPIVPAIKPPLRGK